MSNSVRDTFHKLTIRLLSRLETLPARAAGGKVVYVTSAKEGEGKSFVASWLAVTAATITGQRVLLIDANMEAPALGAMFGIEAEAGLSDALATRAWDALPCRDTDYPNLQVLTAGTQRLPGLLFQHQTMEDFLATVRSRFDLVFVDSASIGQSGANSLAMLADGIFMVIDSSATRWQVLEHALSELNVDKERIVGSVLNKKVQYIPSFIYERI